MVQHAPSEDLILEILVQLDQLIHIYELSIFCLGSTQKLRISPTLKVSWALKSLQFRTQLLAAFFQSAILEVILQIIRKVHYLPLEYLHFMRQLVELDHIFRH